MLEPHILGGGILVFVDSNFWSSIKTKLKNRYDNNSKLLENWLDPIELLETKQSDEQLKIIFGVPNSFFHYYISQNLQDKIFAEISSVYGSKFSIEFVITGKNSQVENKLDLHEVMQNSESNQSLNIQPAQMTIQKVEYKANNQNSLNPDFTFGTFVVGKNTEFAHAATFNVANNPGADDYNPLLIYGPSGLGKTHLLNAAGNRIIAQFPHLRVTYISAERFLNECVSSMRRHEMDKFRLRYRENSDILLVDDVQYIGRGEAVQEEFFHIINAFIEKRKQVILASDRMPKDILGLEDRSRTRLERGLIADITMPDLETRIAILKYKAELFNIRIPEEAMGYIARISKKSIRELEGNLRRIKMFSELQGLQIDLELAKRILAQHENQTSLSIEDIQKLVTEHYKIRMTDIKSSSRAKPIVIPRQIAMFLIKKFLDKSLVDIGRSFGGKDHTTVINALERIESLQAVDPVIKSDIEELTNQIHNLTGL